jgi:DNA-binding NtrC family response regulator
MGRENECDFRVIVADDERVIADTLALILKGSGFNACAVYSGEQALGLAREWGADALISDFMMPGMNGIETAIAIRAIDPTCSIILFSGHGTLNTCRSAEEKGFEVLAKPVQPDRLLRWLQDLRDRRCSEADQRVT